MNSSYDIISKARANLLLDTKPSAAFLATLAMQLRVVVTTSVDTFCTDGTTMWANPVFSEGLTTQERIAVVAHEVLHCALLHVFRRGARDPQLYNIAADHVVNNMLTEWGFQLPKGCYNDPQYRAMSVEQVYAKLYAGQQPPQQQSPDQGNGSQQQADKFTWKAGDVQQVNGKGKGKANGEGAPSAQPDPNPGNGPGDAVQDAQSAPQGPLCGCPTGSFVDAPPQPQGTDPDGEPVPPPMTAEDWAILAEQAAMAARAAGTMPGGLEQFLKAARAVETNWYEELRQYITQAIPTSSSWARPNRRFVGAGTYLPGPVKDAIGELVVFVDSSGSTWGRMLKAFGEHTTAIVEEVQPERVTVVYVDTHVRAVEEYAVGDTVELQAKGGGGTRFQPAFDWLEENDRHPLAVIYMTDLDNSDYGKLREPSCPVVWATPKWITREPEFGNVVRVDAV